MARTIIVQDQNQDAGSRCHIRHQQEPQICHGKQHQDRFQKKGQKECINAFLNALKDNKPTPIPLEEIFETHRFLLNLTT